MKWPAEMIPKTGAALEPSFKPVSGEVSGDGKSDPPYRHDGPFRRDAK